MIMRILVLMSGLALLAPGAVAGERLFGSNLSWMGYPDPQCTRPGGAPDPRGASQYEVQAYARQMEDYNRCVQRYRQGARGDIKDIRRAADEAEGRPGMRFGGGTESNWPWRRDYPSVDEVCEGEKGRDRERCVRQYVRDAENDVRRVREGAEGL